MSKDASERDGFDQLLRRLILVIQMDEQNISAVEYNTTNRRVGPIPNTNRPNPYSRANRPVPTVNALSLCASIFDDNKPQTDLPTEPAERTHPNESSQPS